jgi:hypothetical protein
MCKYQWMSGNVVAYQSGDKTINIAHVKFYQCGSYDLFNNSTNKFDGFVSEFFYKNQQMCLNQQNYIVRSQKIHL